MCLKFHLRALRDTEIYPLWLHLSALLLNARNCYRENVCSKPDMDIVCANDLIRKLPPSRLSDVLVNVVCVVRV